MKDSNEGEVLWVTVGPMVMGFQETDFRSRFQHPLSASHVPAVKFLPRYRSLNRHNQYAR